MDGLEHALDEARLESERKLVQEYELRTRHQAARYSAHLLLAAAHRLRRLLGAVLEYREELVHLFDALRYDALVGDAEGPELEVLAHAELREEPAPLGNVADAVLDYLEGRLFGDLFGDIFAAERYRAGFGMHEPRYRAHRRRFSRAVRAEYRDDLALFDVQRYSVDYGDVVVGAEYVVDFKHTRHY